MFWSWHCKPSQERVSFEDTPIQGQDDHNESNVPVTIAIFPPFPTRNNIRSTDEIPLLLCGNWVWKDTPLLYKNYLKDTN